MSRCELSGKGPVVKNLVSHSNIKTKFKAQPNVQYKQLFSNTLNRSVRLQIATSTVRTLEHNGGFDTYILNTQDKNLSKRALTVKNKIKHALSRKKSAPKAAKAEKVAKVAKTVKKKGAKS